MQDYRYFARFTTVGRLVAEVRKSGEKAPTMRALKEGMKILQRGGSMEEAVKTVDRYTRH